ncbi:MAG: DUF5056 domain-containing protein [Bacteroides sp.]|nr:DUF5056 domain-containing protein [Bacteroides sp.]
MMVNEDRLLKQFFNDNRQEMADNGFTRRVMQHLPHHNRTSTRLWGILGTALTLFLFVALDGLQLIAEVLRETFMTITQDGMENFDLRTVVLSVGVLLFLLYQKIASLA